MMTQESAPYQLPNNVKTTFVLGAFGVTQEILR
jgi:hypothetical protein